MKIFWQIGNIASVIFALIANYLVGVQVLGMPSISEISDKYSTLLTPAGYAFSIWSLIYLLIVVLAVYQARDIFNSSDDNDLPGRIGPLFIASNILNGLWTYIFVSELVLLSVLILLAMTGLLYGLIWHLNIAMNQVSFKQTALVWWPILVYTGWVTVASVVNIASWLDSIGISLSAFMSLVIIILLGAFLIWLLINRNVRELVLASVWGVLAIGVNQQGNNGDTLVIVGSFAVSGLLLATVLAHAIINRKDNLFAQALNKR